MKTGRGDVGVASVGRPRGARTESPRLLDPKELSNPAEQSFPHTQLFLHWDQFDRHEHGPVPATGCLELELAPSETIARNAARQSNDPIRQRNASIALRIPLLSRRLKGFGVRVPVVREEQTVVAVRANKAARNDASVLKKDFSWCVIMYEARAVSTVRRLVNQSVLFASLLIASVRSMRAARNRVILVKNWGRGERRWRRATNFLNGAKIADVQAATASVTLRASRANNNVMFNVHFSADEARRGFSGVAGANRSVPRGRSRHQLERGVVRQDSSLESDLRGELFPELRPPSCQLWVSVQPDAKVGEVNGLEEEVRCPRSPDLFRSFPLDRAGLADATADRVECPRTVPFP